MESGSGASAAFGAIGLVGGLLLVVALLVPLIPGFFLQFYPAAIVIGGASALESFRYSYALVRANLASTLGYTLVAFTVGLLGLVPPAVSGGGQLVTRLAFEQATGNQLVGATGGAIVQFLLFVATFFVVKSLLVYVVRTYYVAFVRSVTGSA